eukprot:gene34751-33599_t
MCRPAACRRRRRWATLAAASSLPIHTAAAAWQAAAPLFGRAAAALSEPELSRPLPVQREGGDERLVSAQVGDRAEVALLGPNATLRPRWTKNIGFTLTGGAGTLEVVVLVGGHWEGHVHAHIERIVAHGGKEEPIDKLDVACNDFFEECGQQRYFQYTLPPVPQFDLPPSLHRLPPDPSSPYTGRLAFRVQPAIGGAYPRTDGSWRLQIANNLPLNAAPALVQVLVAQRQYTYWRVVAPGAAAIVVGVLCLIAVFDTLL